MKVNDQNRLNTLHDTSLIFHHCISRKKKPLPEILRSNLLALQSCHQISTQLKGYWWQQGQQSQSGAGRGGIRQIFEET